MKRRISITLTIILVAAIASIYSISVGAFGNGPSASGSAHVQFAENEFRHLSFNAVTHSDGSVTGHITLHNRLTNGVVFVDVDCISISGNVATISGVIPSANFEPYIGQTGYLRIVDNGQGANAAPDRTSRLLVLPTDLNVPCTHPLPGFPLFDVANGNLQVNP